MRGGGRGVPRGSVRAVGDTQLLDDIVDLAEGDLCAREARAVAQHASVQFAEVDRNADGTPMLGMLGLPLSYGTPLHDAMTLDVEDYPILFALDRAAGGRSRPRRFDHVLIDEAQEFAPADLALIGRAARGIGAITVAGDEGQAVDPSAWYAGWDATLRYLGRSDAQRIRLTQSHRCPVAVVDLARAVIARRRIERTGPGVHLARHATDRTSRQALAAWIADRQPRSTVALIARDRAAARDLHRSLPVDLGARLALDRADRLHGVVVTTVDRVRGLEIDRVAVPDLSPDRWPDTGSARSALYVAVTAGRCRASGSARRGAGRRCSRSPDQPKKASARTSRLSRGGAASSGRAKEAWAVKRARPSVSESKVLKTSASFVRIWGNQDHRWAGL